MATNILRAEARKGARAPEKDRNGSGRRATMLLFVIVCGLLALAFADSETRTDWRDVTPVGAGPADGGLR